MNNRRLDERIYGDIPDTFDVFLQRTLREEPRKARAPKPRVVFAMALSILLLAGTALAVAHSLKIIDLFGLGGVSEKEAEKVIDTSVPQNGGATAIADFKVSEAFYDGTFLRFIIESTAKQDAVLRNASFAMLKETEETAGLPGPRYGVQANVNAPRTDFPFSIGMGYSGGDLYLYANHFIREDTGEDSVDVSIDIDVLDIDDGSLVDGTTLAFTIHKTTTPLTSTYDLAFDTDYVRLERVVIAKTPLETVVSLDYRPLLRAFGSFTVVPADGYIVKGESMYRFGNVGTLPDRADGGRMTMQYFLPVEQGTDNALLLWITSTDQAIEIDLDTGRAAAYTVAVIAKENSVKIEKVED